jgi:hypothetical protein
MKRTIENQLKLLIGLPLWDSGRTLSLVWFDFGKNISKGTNRKGETILLAEYTIDTESAWHIRGKKGLIVASADRFYAGAKTPTKALKTLIGRINQVKTVAMND